MTERLTLAESRPLAEAADVGQAATGRMLVQIITPGWGASGYYGPDVLEAAGTDKVFASGTQMFIDHPTEDEDEARPGRSVKDLAAVLLEDASWNGEALVAPIRTFSPWRGSLSEMATDIGVSIRAAAMVSEGEAEGRTGRIVEKLLAAESVDFVTKAGRGGRILEVLEAAESAVVDKAVTQGVAEATANETREQLSNQLRERFAGGDDTWLWVRDFDDANVWYELESPGDFATYQLGYSSDKDGTVSLSEDDPIEVRAQTTYVPVAPSAESEQTETPETPATEAEGTESPEGDTPEPAEEASAEPATESAEPSTPSPEEDHMSPTPSAGGTAPLGPRQVIETQLAEMRGQVAQMRARERAREVIVEALGDAWLTPSTVARLSAELIADLPIVNDTLDEAALSDRAVAARDRAEAEVAEALTAAGVGQPRQLGQPSTSDAGKVDLDGRLGNAFKELGLSEAAAETAVKGR